VQNFALKFQAVAERAAKILRGILFMPHPAVYTYTVSQNTSKPKCFCYLQIMIKCGRWCLE